jgi:lipopolysaccharide export system permease protein
LTDSKETSYLTQPLRPLPAGNSWFGYDLVAIVDRYLLRLFVWTLFVCVFSVSGLFVLIDAVVNSDELTAAAKHAPHGAGRFFLDYYLPRVLAFIDNSAGVTGMGAAMVALTLLARSNEQTALVAAGIPPRRFALPMIWGAVCVSLLCAANREFALPHYRDQLRVTAQDLQKGASRKGYPRYDMKTQVLIRAERLSPRERRIEAVSIRLPPELKWGGPEIDAYEGWFMDADPATNRPAGIKLKHITRPVGHHVFDSASINGQRIIWSEKDYPDLLEPNECYLVTQVTFDQLSGSSQWARYLSSYELYRGIVTGELDYANDILVILHLRLVQPLIDVSLSLLGIAVVLHGSQRNVWGVVGVALAVVIGFLMLSLACQAAGASGLISATLAAWLPLLIFGPLAVAKMRPLYA